MTTSDTRGRALTSSDGLPDPQRVGTDLAARQWLSEALGAPRYEVLALPRTLDQVGTHVPHTVTTTVATSDRRGLEPSLTLTEQLSAAGYRAVPHLPARLVRDRAHLKDILQRLEEAGVTDVFVVAGDGDPLGEFRDSISMLGAIMSIRAEGVGLQVGDIGVAGYPQGHPRIPATKLVRALQTKSGPATYVVSQMCFDHHSISTWLGVLRDDGIDLPAYVGIAGALDTARLLRIAGRIGVQDSAGFLLRHRGHGIGRLLLPGGHRPDRLVRRIAHDGAVARLAVTGLHIYTLGSIPDTERWRRRVLERLDSETAS